MLPSASTCLLRACRQKLVRAQASKRACKQGPLAHLILPLHLQLRCSSSVAAPRRGELDGEAADTAAEQRTAREAQHRAVWCPTSSGLPYISSIGMGPHAVCRNGGAREPMLTQQQRAGRRVLHGEAGTIESRACYKSPAAAHRAQHGHGLRRLRRRARPRRRGLQRAQHAPQDLVRAVRVKPQRVLAGNKAGSLVGGLHLGRQPARWQATQRRVTRLRRLRRGRASSKDGRGTRTSQARQAPLQEAPTVPPSRRITSP